MGYRFVDFPIRNKVAYDLAVWMDDIKYTQRTKASKLYKMVKKYEKLNEPYQKYTHVDCGRIYKVTIPYNVIAPIE